MQVALHRSEEGLAAESDSAMRAAGEVEGPPAPFQEQQAAFVGLWAEACRGSPGADWPCTVQDSGVLESSAARQRCGLDAWAYLVQGAPRTNQEELPG
ncbi:hypothetical protein NDU88_004583 [Pleurodeles waltl]|uniref:Uncharacterized protein n=1 Tax=Pleurodeles waltl TaxID=8319 RepID=A0AAV7MAG7_PLEWA|nr:hypothetical protein NDU88_004583 [Pleurodeles waltl]